MNMKSAKDEEKLKGPLFPRLHINDKEKGGPRAPPRNKMALYEQLSIPSQRFSSGSASLLPTSLVSSTSSSQGGGRTKTVFSPFCNSPASPHLDEKLYSCSSSGGNVTTTLMDFEVLTVKSTSKNPTAPSDLSTPTKCSSFQPHTFFKKFTLKKLGDEDDPVFAQLKRTPSGGNSQENVDNQKVSSTSTPKFSLSIQTACEKQLSRNRITDWKSRTFLGNQTEENPKVSQASQDQAEMPAPILSNGKKISVSVKPAHVSLNKENINELQKLQDFNDLRENKVLNDGASEESQKAMRKRNYAMLEGASSSKPSCGDCHRSPNRCEIVSECREDRECGFLKDGDVDRKEDDSDASMVDSISGANVSPDDVVGVIGQKEFWKVRRAIVNQQRVFAVQVFELHRLINVQRLIAGSPNILLEKNIYLEKPSVKVSPLKNLTSELVLEPLPSTAKPKEDIDTNKGFVSQQSSCRPYAGNPPIASIAADKLPPWYFHPPPANQWLVPVMSPSEGLVYKPYDPNSGFTRPVYGGCGPTNLTPLSGDFLAATYGVPGSQHKGIGILPGTPPMGQPYFPPYGMPVVNPSFSSSAARGRSNGHDNQIPTGGFDLIVPYKSFSTTLSEKSVQKVQASKESDFQGSTASSPVKVQSNALPLFPTAPSAQSSDERGGTRSFEHRSRVIKVVPHNPRSATESAARIFKSIQEERKQYDEAISHTVSGL